jgi:ClpP class serine protease
MKVNKLLTSVLTGPWLVDRSTAETYLPMLERFLAGQTIGIEDQKPENPVCAVTFSAGQLTSYASFDEAPEGSVAIINLSGPMMREDGCFSYGTETLARMTQEAYSHPNISALVKVISSGGGQVNGTEQYAAVLAASPKPVVTYVKGMMASAAYWVGSKAQHIMLEGRTAMVGSIGTQFMLQDQSARLAAAGVKLHIIRATNSPDKNESTEQASKGNYAPIREEQIDPLNNVFHEDVKAARPDISQDALTGKMFVGQAAIDAGMADSFGTLQDAIDMALELATTSKSNLSNSNNPMFGKNKFAALAALASVEAISADQLQAANAELEAAGISLTLVSASDLSNLNAASEKLEGLNSENATLRSNIETLNSSNTALEKDLQDMTAEVTRLKALPGATHTDPKAEGSEITEESDANEPKTSWEAKAERKAYK